MWRESSRRDFCRLLLAGAAGAAASPRVFAQAGGSASLEVNRLSDSLMVVSGAGGNVTLALGPDSALLVNGGNAATSAALLAKVAELAGGKPVRTLFNTDWHVDHTGANDALGKAGAQIIAHEFTRQYLGSEMRLDWQGGKTYKPRAPQALPTKTFYTTGSMTFGGETDRLRPPGTGAHRRRHLRVLPQRQRAGGRRRAQRRPVPDCRLQLRRLAGRHGHGQQGAARPHQARHAASCPAWAPCRRARRSRRTTTCCVAVRDRMTR